jgi:hypothetical protein
MFTTYVGVTVLAAAASAYAATADFLRLRWIFDNMTKMGVPHSWLVPLGTLKAAGTLGLLIGIGVPLVGIAAAVGLILFFVGAVLTHVRAHAETSTYPYPVGFLLLAVGSLVLRVASS